MVSFAGDRTPMIVEARTLAVSRTTSGPFPGESPFVYGVAVWLALVQISIAAAEIVLAVIVFAWLVLLRRRETAFVRLPLDRPFAIYAGASLASALFSFAPPASLLASKKLLLLVVPYLLVSVVGRKETLESLSLLIIAVADVSALLGLWQYTVSDLGDLDNRIRGFMGHYMTYSGLLMCASVLAVAHLLFRRKHRWFLGSSLAVIGLALLFTLTRSAWVGTLAASILLLWMRNRRLLLAVPVLGIGAILVLPVDVEDRLDSFLRPDVSGWDRIYMLRAGARMIGNHPLLGVGPDMVPDVYPIYMVEEAPLRENLHLHNNLAHISAERGLICGLSWLWFFGLALLASIRGFRRAKPEDEIARSLAAAALGVMVAAFSAGLFEYNFGDSEFQMLLLFVMTIPFFLEREERAAR